MKLPRMSRTASSETSSRASARIWEIFSERNGWKYSIYLFSDFIVNNFTTSYDHVKASAFLSGSRILRIRFAVIRDAPAYILLKVPEEKLIVIHMI